MTTHAALSLGSDRPRVFADDFDVLSGYRLAYTDPFPTVRFGDARWDFRGVPRIPKGLRPSHLTVDWTRIAEPDWCLVCKELLAAVLCPLHPPVARLPYRRRWPLPLIGIRQTVSQTRH